MESKVNLTYILVGCHAFTLFFANSYLMRFTGYKSEQKPIVKKSSENIEFFKKKVDS